MHALQVSGDKIVDGKGQAVRLRGPFVGGWMNMENYMNGYPGSEQGARAAMVNILGKEKGEFFFNRMLDYFLAEEDIAFIKQCGATAVRLSLNYRHFERDDKPFEYLEPGFQRLDKTIDWCGKHGVYAILDMHSVQGWQSAGFHCDNESRHSLFWEHRLFQDRFVALWEEFARRYKANPVVAGYDLMNEPITYGPRGLFYDLFSPRHTPNWEVLNRVYRRTVAAIRAIDPDHIICLQGDFASYGFEGLDAPFNDNLVYSSHNYVAPGIGPGPYPGIIGGEYWDIDKHREAFLNHEGTRFARKHGVPLWAGECGSVYNGPADEVPYRLRSLDDQIAILEEEEVHWTVCTYKDMGVMGWVHVDPQSQYVRAAGPVLQAKRLLCTDTWLTWLPPTPALEMVNSLARLVEKTIPDPDINPRDNQAYLARAALGHYVGALMQPAYAKCFVGMSEEEIDEVMQSFALKKCKPRQDLIEIIRKHTSSPG